MPQIQTDHRTVTQITVIEAEPEKQQEALSLMAERARFMARQPGFVSISLHRSLDGRRIVNYVQWKTRGLLQQAHQSPDFRKAWRKFDDLTDQIDPHLYEVTEVMDADCHIGKFAAVHFRTCSLTWRCSTLIEKLREGCIRDFYLRHTAQNSVRQAVSSSGFIDMGWA